MYALTIKQPWAYCITHDKKRIENRTWKPPEKIIGQRIALHTSQKLDKGSLRYASRLAGRDLSEHVEDMPCGCVVGSAVVVGYQCRPTWDSVNVKHVDENHPAMADRSMLLHWHVQHEIGWILHDVQVLSEPVPMKGRLGIWTIEQSFEELTGRLLPALAEGE